MVRKEFDILFAGWWFGTFGLFFHILGSGSLFWLDILVSNDMGVIQIDVLSHEDKLANRKGQ
jgi:hypothetical protein